MQHSSKTLTPEDKAPNMYELRKKEYNKILRDSVTSTYKKTNDSIKKRTNKKGKEIVKKLFEEIIDRIDANAESNSFITIKEKVSTKETF